MWSIFSRDPAKDFAYTIGEKIAGLEDKSVWSLHQGKKKATGDPVSVFAFDVKNSSESQIGLAKASFKRIKTLRHPNILTFLDGIETDKVIYIATEPVTPLETYLQNNDASQKQNQLAIAWGFHKIVKGLAFLVNDCNLIHNNVCMSSIFVDQAGEWKLGGVDYVYPATGQDSVPPVKILPYLERYDPPEKSDLRRGIKGEKWSSDMWGLGCLIWEVFNGPLPRTSALKAFGKIPKSLVPNYCELVSANPSSRPNPAKFIQDCCRQGGFMNNPFVKTMLFLEEIQIKDQTEKTKFFNNLTNALDSFPVQLSKHKVLPQLLNAFEFGNAGSSVLAPLFKVGKLLDTEEYQNKIVPCVVKLFSSTDRTTRVKLLQQIDLFIEHLQAPTVNDKIFPNVVSGFMDTNPVVRESTIKAILHLAPKLNYKNLNEELMKHFARLQSKDDQGGIRTNTTVCLGKIASYLNPQLRQRILCSAFLRALKDPFPPARQAGIIGMAVTQNLFTLSDLCMKLMPPLCSMMMDPEKQVRDQAFKTVRSYIDKLEKLSEDPDLKEEMEKDVLSGGTPVTGAAGWAGWAIGGVSSLTSKVYSKATKGKQAAGPGSNLKGKTPIETTSEPSSAPGGISAAPAPEPTDTGQEEEEEEGGWDDEDWGDIDSPRTTHAPVVDSTSDSGQNNEANDGWDNDDDDWGSLEDTSSTQTSQYSNHKTDSSRDRPQQSSHVSSSTKSSENWGWGNEPSSTHSDSFKYDSHSETSEKTQKGALKLGGGPKKAPADDFSWIEEEFAPIEDSNVAPASSYNWGQSDNTAGDDFFSMATGFSSQKPKPKPSKPSTTQGRSSPARSTPTRESPSSTQPAPGSQDPGGGAGWGDAGGWEADSWDDLNSNYSQDSKQSEAERKKREREEKRQHRQQELTQRREARKGGAMKLGAKKLASD